jgi:hypothetical protein
VVLSLPYPNLLENKRLVVVVVVVVKVFLKKKLSQSVSQWINTTILQKDNHLTVCIQLDQDNCSSGKINLVIQSVTIHCSNFKLWKYNIPCRDQNIHGVAIEKDKYLHIRFFLLVIG